MNKYITYILIVFKHIRLVRKLCFKCGLHWRGLAHDLSKFGIIELSSGARYYRDIKKSPVTVERSTKGVSEAWQHHINKNAHHWEHWVEARPEGNKPLEIPYEYIVEMVCDWIGSSVVYSKNETDFKSPYPIVKEYIEARKDTILLAPMTKATVDTFLNVIAEKGVYAFCSLAKSKLA